MCGTHTATLPGGRRAVHQRPCSSLFAVFLGVWHSLQFMQFHIARRRLRGLAGVYGEGEEFQRSATRLPHTLFSSGNQTPISKQKKRLHSVAVLSGPELPGNPNIWKAFQPKKERPLRQLLAGQMRKQRRAALFSRLRFTNCNHFAVQSLHCKIKADVFKCESNWLDPPKLKRLVTQTD